MTRIVILFTLSVWGCIHQVCPQQVSPPSSQPPHEPIEVYYTDPPGRTPLQRWLILGPVPVQDIVDVLKERGDYKEINSKGPNIYISDEQEYFGWSDYENAMQQEALFDSLTERDFKPDHGETVTMGEREYSWQRYDSKRRDVNLDDVFQRHENAVVYAYTEIEWSAPRNGFLIMRSDDSMKLWLNGEPVYTFLGGRGLTQERDPVSVTMTQGKNRILVKVMNIHMDWGFGIQYFDEQDLPFPLRFQHSLKRFSSAVREDSSVIWMPFVLGVLVLFVVIALFLVFAMIFGKGEKLSKS